MKKQSTPFSTPINSLTHHDKRTNISTVKDPRISTVTPMVGLGNWCSWSEEYAKLPENLGIKD